MDAETYRLMYRDRLQRILVAAWIALYLFPIAGGIIGWIAIPISWIGCLGVSLFMTRRAGSRNAGPVYTTFVALIFQCSLGVVAALFGTIIDFGSDPPSVFQDDEARRRIGDQARGPLPESATDFYLFDGGTIMGSITYWSFSCAFVEECWAAFKTLKAPEPDEFEPWRPSQYAVVMEGPSFYQETTTTPDWDVRTISNGVVYEYVQDKARQMRYYAIDFDSCRVYYHYESGGFPADEYPRKSRD